MVGARIFVALCFVILGASFFASTALLIQEFRGGDWFTMVVAHSHLFFFFPVLGVLALFAFYLPSVVFTHLYWTHLPYGKMRFLLGIAVVAARSYGFANISTSLRGPSGRFRRRSCADGASRAEWPILDTL